MFVTPLQVRTQLSTFTYMTQDTLLRMAMNRCWLERRDGLKEESKKPPSPNGRNPLLTGGVVLGITFQPLKKQYRALYLGSSRNIHTWPWSCDHNTWHDSRSCWLTQDDNGSQVNHSVMGFDDTFINFNSSRLLFASPSNINTCLLYQ